MQNDLGQRALVAGDPLGAVERGEHAGKSFACSLVAGGAVGGKHLFAVGHPGGAWRRP